MATTLVDGAHVRLTARHGDVDRVLTGTLRRFEQDGEARWELVDATEDRSDHKDASGQPAYDKHLVMQSYPAVGIDESNVVSVDTLH